MSAIGLSSCGLAVAIDPVPSTTVPGGKPDPAASALPPDAPIDVPPDDVVTSSPDGATTTTTAPEIVGPRPKAPIYDPSAPGSGAAPGSSEFCRIGAEVVDNATEAVQVGYTSEGPPVEITPAEQAAAIASLRTAMAAADQVVELVPSQVDRPIDTARTAKAIDDLQAALDREPPDGDVRSTFYQWVQERDADVAPVFGVLASECADQPFAAFLGPWR